MNERAEPRRDAQSQTNESAERQSCTKRFGPNQQAVGANEDTDQHERHRVDESHAHLVEWAPQTGAGLVEWRQE